MLKQAGIPQKGSNEQGSVLLAVVCMGMVTMTLATVALGMIQYNTRATARNVERSQAKITAEAALTEFVSSYNGNYDDLKTFSAGRSAASTPIDVTFLNSSGSDNSANFGVTKINVYPQGSGFKVTSTCDYMGQVQTASLIFAANQNNPYVPTNTLESSEGSDYSDRAWAVDGDIYLEKKTGDPKETMSFHNANAKFHSHIYTEYNFIGDTSFELCDVRNVTGSKNFEPNKSRSDAESGAFFRQAFTLRTKGYFAMMNPIIYGTSVGKTDMNGRNRDDAGYDPDNLSNKDGWIYAESKIILGYNTPSSGYGVGNDPLTPCGALSTTPGLGNNPIDMYSHGMYVGPIPDTIAGAANTEKSSIESAFSGYSWMDSRTHTVNGNIYCYKGSGSTAADNGDLVIGGSNTLDVYGDLVVEGTIYIAPGSKINLHGHKLYCDNIKKLDGSNYSSSQISGATICSFASLSDPSSSNYDPTTRKNLPSVGYSPSTGTDDTVRKSLKSTYQNATSNKIFKESLNPANTYYSSAKNIAEKYATAMSRTLDTKYRNDTNDPLTEKHITTIDGNQIKVTQINDSIRLRKEDLATTSTSSDILSKVYNIKLTDHDIVVAIPIDGLENTIMRIDSTDRTQDCFVYYMYYDESDCTFTGDTYDVSCLYLSDTDHQFVVPRRKNDGTGNENITINLDQTSQSDRSTKVIDHYSSATVGSISGSAVSGSSDKWDSMLSISICDPTLWENYKDNDDIDFDDYYHRMWKPYTTPGDNLYLNKLENFDEQTQENLTMFLVPDDTKFELGGVYSIQGIVYGPGADVQFMEAVGDKVYVFGQVKCRKFTGPGNKDLPMIYNIPPARNSIMDYVGAVNATTSTIDIAYYQY